ncbi:hypothetical protein K443DRAFT_13765 [Laccaria amethystina LaAM-08-1]|uniref:Uncharacterized protein n=1 Tax=Laccaria amethystina LaAM-08-1 TaxID=1095629 RepID=A0A0C9WI28_9AGAR|nr:hypothetical protein K443DRAFT_13765 [Laccaria amethystina LaAM-08-1]
MTSGTHTPLFWFFEEEEAANMPYSADTMDGRVSGYGCVDGGRFVLFPLLLLPPYGRHYRRSNMHCFSHILDFAAHYFTHFLSFTLDRGYGTHSFLPLSPRLSTAYRTRNLPAPNVLYEPLLLLVATSIPERGEAVEMPYGDDTLDSGVRDERGGEG